MSPVTTRRRRSSGSGNAGGALSNSTSFATGHCPVYQKMGIDRTNHAGAGTRLASEHREDHVDVDRLYVKEIFVDGGPVAKRVRPAPMGRAFRILRRQSHITIKLDTRKGDGKKK